MHAMGSFHITHARTRRRELLFSLFRLVVVEGHRDIFAIALGYRRRTDYGSTMLLLN